MPPNVFLENCRFWTEAILITDSWFRIFLIAVDYSHILCIHFYSSSFLSMYLCSHRCSLSLQFAVKFISCFALYNFVLWKCSPHCLSLIPSNVSWVIVTIGPHLPFWSRLLVPRSSRSYAINTAADHWRSNELLSYTTSISSHV